MNGTNNMDNEIKLFLNHIYIIVFDTAFLAKLENVKLFVTVYLIWFIASDTLELYLLLHMYHIQQNLRPNAAKWLIPLLT